ncbi:acetyl/propionyl/methylcrotonyl-CoA carboxylase subunit alpha [Hydrocarboniclastica marina]|uniref:Biotin carboxylase n=1 Tax=Hydrocarboniclastica marina TaxID=2259620 RepID=A0A4P7XHX7_9ALTE|nr:acetyl-CoA carboxylase biotin carboxylase subunit [Hydrocarboniclastica marina]QCF26651.1 acetyl-CoA carboxylase biotin carboxylase subunit [Hydrocarboniclastica marina]
MSFNKLLVANRGEIAVRIIRTARALGYDTVAVFSEADADALHVAEADESVWLGPAAASASYLNIDAILDAAKRTGAEAVHPGYGFLSENAEFARACGRAGLVFIGPPADAIELMGSKRRSKIAMQEAGVPTVPGYEGASEDDSELANQARRIGYPVMIKASAGGGGRGMRRVDGPDELPGALARARSESLNAFGSDELILEKALVDARHIEVQVFADQHGNVIHLGERDCSVQRRHQKVVEEAPSPFVDEKLRAALGEAAVNAARACKYQGAGTVEFLVDFQRQFYFLEMNTRLQVEHPVTECVTGQDLVAWQLAVAAGQSLPLTQDQVTLQGHAIEVRLYAEDPANGYMPQTGRIDAWQPLAGEGIRVDTGVREGSSVSPHYDPMLAKMIAWGPDRETARRRLGKVLRQSFIAGVTTNQAFLAEILAAPAFARGEATTEYLDHAFAGAKARSPRPTSNLLVAIAAVVCAQRAGTAGWSNSLPSPVSLDLEIGESLITVSLMQTGRRFRVFWAVGERVGDEIIDLIGHEPGALILEHNGVRRHCRYVQKGAELWCQCQGEYGQVTDRTGAPPAATLVKGDGQLSASMDGKVITVDAAPGQRVAQGDLLLVLEAMKMEHPLRANTSGVVETVHTEAGAQVRRKQLLVSIIPDPMDAET